MGTPNKTYDSLKGRMEMLSRIQVDSNYLDIKFNALESNTTYDSKTVSTYLDEKFKSYIKTAAKDNSFKNQTLTQIHLSEIKRKFQRIKDEYQFYLFDWLCSEKGFEEN